MRVAAGLQVYHRALDVIWEGTLSDLPSHQGLRPVLHQLEATWLRARPVSPETVGGLTPGDSSKSWRKCIWILLLGKGSGQQLSTGFYHH